MKSLVRSLTAVSLAPAVALSTTAWAGDCCKETAEKVKKGEACSKCVEHACCKETAAKLEKDGEAKACAKCAKKD